MNLGSLTLLSVAPENSRHVLLRGASCAQPRGWGAPEGGRSCRGELSPQRHTSGQKFPEGAGAAKPWGCQFFTATGPPPAEVWQWAEIGAIPGCFSAGAVYKAEG